jgi:alpha-N-arabinofuranosidase
MINVLQAMIMTRGPRMILTPTYHVFRLYVPFQDATFLPVRVDAGLLRSSPGNLPRLDAIAARDAGGKVWLAAVNIDPHNAVTVRISIDSGETHSATGEVLTAARVDAVNDFDAPETVKPAPLSGHRTARGLELDLPAQSVAVVEIR